MSNERQPVYDMREETAEFLKNVRVKEHFEFPAEWELIPIDTDKRAEFYRNAARYFK